MHNGKFKKLIKSDFFFIIFSQIIYKIGAFCSSIFLARILVKDDYGLYSYCNNIISIFLLLNGLGTSDAILQVGCENDGNIETQAAYSWFGLKIGLIGNTLISLAIVIYSLFFQMDFEGAKLILLLMAIQPILMYINNYDIIQLRIYKKDKRYSIQNALSGVLISVFSILGALILEVSGVVMMQDIAYVVIIFIGLGFVFPYLKNIKQRRKLNKSEKKSFIFLCLSFIAIILVSHLLTVMDVFVLGKVLKDTEIIANYKVASIIPNAMVFLPSSLMVYAYPYFIRHKDDYNWVKKHSILLIVAGFIVFGLIAVLCICLSDWILCTIYGEQYIAASGAFKVLIISFVFNATFNIAISNILISKRKAYLNVIVSAVMGIANIVLNVFLIMAYGSIGAAYATLISTVVGTILYLTFFIVIMLKQKKKLANTELNCNSDVDEK